MQVLLHGGHGGEGRRRHLLPDLQGGVRGHRGPVRLRQVHLHEHHRLPGRAHRWHLPAGRPGCGPDEQERAGRDPQRAAGLYLPAVQPAAQAEPGGKRGGAPDVRRGAPGGAAGAGPAGPGDGGPEGQIQAPALRAVRRPAAACVHRPGPGGGSVGDPGRRAHRRPGLPHRAGGAGHHPGAPRRGQHRGPHHPRQLHRRPGPAHHPPGGRPRDLRRPRRRPRGGGDAPGRRARKGGAAS